MELFGGGTNDTTDDPLRIRIDSIVNAGQGQAGDTQSTDAFKQQQQQQQELDQQLQQNSLNIIQLWATISSTLWWTVLCVSLVSIPILGDAMWGMLRRYKRSHYFHFLTTMIALDLIMLISILFNLLSDSAFALKGSMTCKVTAFVTNVTSCYSNWLWVVMFAQRLLYVFYPMHRATAGGRGATRRLICILDDTRQVILVTGALSAITQLWAPFLMTEILVLSGAGNVEGSYCGPDSTLVDRMMFKWIAALESVVTYAIPFLITVLTDCAALVLTKDSKRFTIVCAEEMCGGHKTSGVPSAQAPPPASAAVTRHSSHPPRPHASIALTESGGGGGASLTSPKLSTATTTSNVTNHASPPTPPLSGSGGFVTPGTPTLTTSNCAATSNCDSVTGADCRRMVSASLLDKTSVTLPRGSVPSAILPFTRRMSRKTTSLSFGSSIVKSTHRKPAGGNQISSYYSNGVKSFAASNGASTTVSASALKIQSEDSLRACHRRRQRAIRRCLCLATAQLLLNLPNYVLQLVDEFSSLRQTSQGFNVFYLYADAAFYLLYLSQYPMMAVYVRWLHTNFRTTTSSSTVGGVHYNGGGLSTTAATANYNSGVYSAVANGSNRMSAKSTRSSGAPGAVSTSRSSVLGTTPRRRIASCHMLLSDEDGKDTMITVPHSAISPLVTAGSNIGGRVQDAKNGSASTRRRTSAGGVRRNSRCQKVEAF